MRNDDFKPVPGGLMKSVSTRVAMRLFPALYHRHRV